MRGGGYPDLFEKTERSDIFVLTRATIRPHTVKQLLKIRSFWGGSTANEFIRSVGLDTTIIDILDPLMTGNPSDTKKQKVMVGNLGI